MTLRHHQMAVSRGLLSPAGLLRLLLKWGREALHPAEMADIRADLVSLSCRCSCQYVSGAFVGYAQLLICCGRLMLMTRGPCRPLSRDTAGQPRDAGWKKFASLGQVLLLHSALRIAGARHTAVFSGNACREHLACRQL